MIRCARCQNTVDETRQAVCPVCLAPLAAQAATQGQAPPVFTPPPGIGVPPARTTQSQAYAPPPGSPVGASPAAGYAPPPGSPYSAAPAPGYAPVLPAPPLPPISQAPMPGYAPGYAPGVQTRTTLTGEVVATTTPAPTPYSPGNYAPPPGTAPYGNGYPMPAASRPQPAAKTGGWNPLTWKLAGGGTFTALYIAARVFAIYARTMHPYTPTHYETTSPVPSYSSGTRQSYSPGAATPSFSPAPNRNSAFPTQPSTFPTPGNMRSQPGFSHPFPRPNLPAPPNFPSHFQPPNMPGAPHGFSGPGS